jgi:hypothetical protein
MSDEIIRLELPPSHAFLRVARVTAATVGSLAGFDVEQLEDLRIAVDELCSALVELGDGAPLELVLRLDGPELHVAGTTKGGRASGWNESRYNLARQILEVIAPSYRLTDENGSVGFELRYPGGRS